MTGLTARDVAESAGLSFSTIRRAEDSDGPVAIAIESALKLIGALEALGVEFLPPNGDDGGVRYKRQGPLPTHIE